MSFAANAYTRTANSVLSPREAEAAVLINQKVWTLLAGAATAPESPLPIAIKNNIGQLSVFVFRRIIDTLIEPGADKLSALININQQIAAGLRSS
jgi:flagellar protein FlaF